MGSISNRNSKVEVRIPMEPGSLALTAAEASVCGQLQGSLRAVPSVPGKLIFTLLDAALSPGRYAARVNQVHLEEHRVYHQVT